VAKILVADDDDLLCEVLRFKLENMGHTVLVVTDGATALNSAQSEDFDVLILDSMMPALSGMEVLQLLKSDPATSKLPVIMLTARRGEDDVVRALRAGAADYLTKPFVPEVLALRIATVLASRHPDDSHVKS
jgi:DNA-binding response OmpR family regulator